MAGNPQEWLILTTRYGKDIENPSKEDLSHALEELRKDDPKAMTEGDYDEYSNTWLRCGTDDGLMYILSVSKDGTTSLSEFVSQDADDPIGELTRKISSEKALTLWVLLAEGNPDKVEAELENENPTSPE
jgi:hypothetical protein